MGILLSSNHIIPTATENDQVGEETDLPVVSKQSACTSLTSYFAIPMSWFAKGEAHGDANCFSEHRTQPSG